VGASRVLRVKACNVVPGIILTLLLSVSAITTPPSDSPAQAYRRDKSDHRRQSAITPKFTTASTEIAANSTIMTRARARSGVSHVAPQRRLVAAAARDREARDASSRAPVALEAYWAK